MSLMIEQRYGNIFYYIYEIHYVADKNEYIKFICSEGIKNVSFQNMSNLRRIGQVFLELCPSEKIEILPRKSGLTATSRQSLINNSSNN